MSNTNKTIKVFIPFLKATMQVLQELTQEVFIKRNVYTHVGNLTGADYQVEIGIIGDIRSRVLFSFPKAFANQLTCIMLGISDDEADEETIEAAIQEIGNMISGNALGLLEEIGISSDITPPKLYLPGSKAVGDNAQLGVLEFTSNIGNFHVAIVTNENNTVLKNDVILSVGFSSEIDQVLSRFLYPKGMYLIGCSSSNLTEILTEYPPSVILVNTMSPDMDKIKSILNNADNTESIHLVNFGKEFHLEKSYIIAENQDNIEDPYIFLETFKSILNSLEISIYDNRKNIILTIPENSALKAFFNVKTRRGDIESIPITELSFDYILINTQNHEYINFPERKNLTQKNHPQLKLSGNDGLVNLEKSQIGKHISDTEINILLHHILETEIGKITNYMYNVLSCNK